MSWVYICLFYLWIQLIWPYPLGTEDAFADMVSINSPAEQAQFFAVPQTVITSVKMIVKAETPEKLS